MSEHLDPNDPNDQKVVHAAIGVVIECLTRSIHAGLFKDGPVAGEESSVFATATSILQEVTVPEFREAWNDVLRDMLAQSVGGDWAGKN